MPAPTADLTLTGLFAEDDDVLASLLLKQGKVTEPQLESARASQSTTARSLAQTLLDDRVLTRPALLAALAEHTGFALVPALPENLSAELVAELPARFARHYAAVPFGIEGPALLLAVSNPLDAELANELRFALGRPVRLHVADPDAVQALLKIHFRESAPSEQAVLPIRENLATRDVDLAASPPVVTFVNQTLTAAVQACASDLHFEPGPHGLAVRCRCDGALRDFGVPPPNLSAAVVSRIKVLAHLDIAEHRIPQDGRLRVRLAEREVELRVSTLPTQYGESVVLRVLDQQARRLELDYLGLPSATVSAWRGQLDRPDGLLVVTGPTGSGKTTTLYASLHQLNTPDVKILTVEDPVEYELAGATQVSVNPEAGLGFPEALRAFLRHDPDIVMVGEMRDLETARISVQAALTGHLVLSTLHTNDAPAAALRLRDMGVEPYLLATTLSGILAQRLLRRLCPVCRRPSAPVDGQPAFDAPGCPACQHTGYHGRLALFEFLPVTARLRECISSGASLAQLRQQARLEGLITLRDQALAALHRGETSREEILRHT